jgi:hypothetical protein
MISIQEFFISNGVMCSIDESGHLFQLKVEGKKTVTLLFILLVKPLEHF